MKVLALGGSGGMGRHAVRTAQGFEFVDEIVVADRDGEAAVGFAERCNEKVRGAQLDVTDIAALRKLLLEADVVLNTVGPFYRFGVPILEAAIDTGCHYLDINDDWEPTLDMLALHERAEHAGLTAIIGLGASPGISNLLAVKAMAGLDSVDEVLTGWSLDAMDDESDGGARTEHGPSAAMVHWMHQCSGSIRVWRNGGFADVRPVEERNVEFPGFGAGRAWSVGHPEAVTLPLTFPEVRASANLMTGPESLMAAVAELRDAIDARQMTVEQAAEMMSQPMPDDMKQAMRSERTEASRLPPLFALATGSLEGTPRRVGALILGAPDGGMGGITGIPLALGLRLFASGGAPRRGVFAPEGIVDPDAFFEALAPFCHAPESKTRFESVDELVLVTSEPQ
ncbi:MAG: saccharopine dehydrogenase [bacterium]|nr:saccharopine dehydrogenase [bacterium]